MLWNQETFSQFFQEAYGYPPFQWQKELLETVLTQGWPNVLSLPTASGKTAVMDVALFALAAQASLPVAQRTAPRKMIFVVDRRIIVSATYERAQKLRRLLTQATSGILLEIKNALLAYGGEEALFVTELRGGIWKNDSWARTPVQPAVIVSTIDQIGSRILFRGYGLSPAAWPLQAGLLANDSLIILDEAHLSLPFVETLKAIQKYRQWGEMSINTPFGIVQMSATPNATGRIFPADCQKSLMEDAQLRPRLTSPKRTALIEAENSKFIDKCIEATLAKASIPGTTVALIVNRVATARAVFEKLQTKLQKSKNAMFQCILLTGRSRGFERDELIKKYSSRLFSGHPVATDCLPLVVVATQCVEAGADFDFDAMVTEACPLDSLQQRLGRVNRIGLRPFADIDIVINKDDLTSKDKCANRAIYGDTIKETWSWLRELQKNAPDGIVNLSSESMMKELPGLSNEHRKSMIAPVRHAPIFFPAYCNIFEQTSPVADPSPEVSVFLHGPQSGPADVQIIWRADLPSDNPECWKSRLEMLPPMAGEASSVRLEQARGWLSGDKKSCESVLDDDSEHCVQASPKESEQSKPFLIWRGNETEGTTNKPNDIVPGCTIVVPCEYGGCDEFGWCPNSIEPVKDIAEKVGMATGFPMVLRLSDKVLDEKAWESLKEFAQEYCDENEKPSDFTRRLQDALLNIACDNQSIEELCHAMATAKLTLKKCGDDLPDMIPRQIVVCANKRFPLPMTSGGLSPSILDDAHSSASLSGQMITLSRHNQDIQDKIANFFDHLALKSSFRDSLMFAALHHDDGKADPRFQAMLCGGDILECLRAQRRAGGLLAKSPIAPANQAEAMANRKRSGYPEGARHELLSVSFAEKCSAISSVEKDLALHLIASHHGKCRPFAPMVKDSTPVDVHAFGIDLPSDAKMDSLDSGVAERFWRLVNQYGWWGLPYLEAILRLADHRASESEEKEI